MVGDLLYGRSQKILSANLLTINTRKENNKLEEN